MADKTLFEKICDKEIPATVVYEDERCVAFHDRSPQAPLHILIVPRLPIPRLALATADDAIRAALGEGVAQAAGAARLADSAWANEFARAASASLGRPALRIDVTAMTVTY